MKRENYVNNTLLYNLQYFKFSKKFADFTDLTQIK